MTGQQRSPAPCFSGAAKKRPDRCRALAPQTVEEGQKRGAPTLKSLKLGGRTQPRMPFRFKLKVRTLNAWNWRWTRRLR